MLDAYQRAACCRCHGKGLFTTVRRVHMGVPGLCFRCDGSGLEPDALLAFIKAYERSYLSHLD